MILSLSLRIAHAHSSGEVNLPIPAEVVPTLTRAVLWGAVIVIVIMSLIFGSVLAARWELFLRFTNSVPFGQVDPVYGQDLGFYIFNLPVYSFVQGWILGLAIVTLLATVGLNFINYSLRGASYSLTGRRLAHLSVIAAVIMLAMAVGHWLDRWALVLSEDGAVFGATFADLNARRPALLIMTIIAAAAAILLAANVYLRELRIVLGAVITVGGTGTGPELGVASPDPAVFGYSKRVRQGEPVHRTQHRAYAAGVCPGQNRRGVLPGGGGGRRRAHRGQHNYDQQHTAVGLQAPVQRL